MSNLYATEEQEQTAFVAWLRCHPKLKKCVVLIGNEGKRSWRLGQSMKRKGMRKGASDLFIAYPTKKYHGLWIEMKAVNPKSGHYRKATIEQIQFLQDMIERGYQGHVANGCEHAIELTQKYLRD